MKAGKRQAGMVVYASGDEASEMPNQVYAGSGGQIVTLRYDGRTSAKRHGKDIDAVEFHYDITIDDERQHVGVVVSSDASRAITNWLADSRNYGGGDDPAAAIELALDLSIARILEGVDRGVDFKADAKAYPDSFVKIFGADFEDLISTRKTPNSVIKDYIIRRLYAAWKVGGDDIDYAQMFDRPDQLYLRVGYGELKKVIDLYEGKAELWTREVEDQPYLKATRGLILLQEAKAELPASAPASGPTAIAPASKPEDQPRMLMYDVALSYAGEDRPYVDQVAAILQGKRVRVFYDRYEQVTLWGKDNYDHLADVFENRAHFVVMFISKHYAEKVWPNHERKAAQARAVKERREYILPARFDDTKLPGLSGNVGYIDLRDTTPQQLADLTFEKLIQDMIE